MQDRQCRRCGTALIRSKQYCSNICKYAAMRKPREERPGAIQLSNGNWSLVSPEDVEYLRGYGWVETPSGYARRGATKHTSLHRTVMERKMERSLDRYEEVDHINGNRLDNRRSNLRLSTRNQNMRNQHRSSGATGRIGVNRIASGYRSYLVVHYKQVHVGVFSSADEAAWMRDQWAIELHGEYARLNFDYQ